MNQPPGRIRLDQALVERNLLSSRSRAADAVRRGRVSVGGATASKPGQFVAADADIRLNDPAAGYVARSALKLLAGLDSFDFDPTGRQGLDVGASTGGFTEVLLERGAVHVDAIDVGHGQMHARIAADPRVRMRDGLNARDLTAADLTAPPGVVVCDVSFISLKLALPPALALAAPAAFGVFLVKPQFEAGRDHVGKGGLVRDRVIAEEVAADCAAWLDGRTGWRVVGLVPSPIKGGDGNREFLLGAIRSGDPS